MARASHQLDAALVLATHGLHAEVRYVLRGVYESAGLGRYLAKNTDSNVATKWIEKGDWFPDAKVRAWLYESSLVAEEQVGDYRSFYKLASAFAHPTRQSCFDLLRQVKGGLELIVEPEFDVEATRRSIVEITYSALFACFAFLNGIYSQAIIPPAWRHELHSIAQDLTGDDYAHLERDWEAEDRRYAEFVARIQSMANLRRARPEDIKHRTYECQDGDGGLVPQSSPANCNHVRFLRAVRCPARFPPVVAEVPRGQYGMVG